MAGVFQLHNGALVTLTSPLQDAVRDAYQKQFYPLGYVAALDGMRGLMTIGVVVAHVYYPRVPGTVLFIDVFFVASAYYITSLLIRDIERHGRIGYRDFYRRRFARIIPPVIAMVASYLLYRLFFGGPFSTALGHAAIVLSYISNWWMIFDPKNMEDLGHTWSLSVEEQFYILWPVTFAFLVRRIGVTWRLVVSICAIGLAIWIWRICLAYQGVDWMRMYTALDTRSDALMVGSAMAVILRLAPAGKYPIFDRCLPGLAWPLLLYWGAITLFFWSYSGPTYNYYYFGSMICGIIPGTLALIMLIRTSGTICHRIFERPEAVFLGRIFYGIYLWHYPLLYFMQSIEHRWIRLLIGLPLSVLIGTLSYAYIERHFMRQRPRSLQKPQQGADQQPSGQLVAVSALTGRTT
jgi:peptidoglycan/LPS O-acetylase OafA/YrhL